MNYELVITQLIHTPLTTLARIEVSAADTAEESAHNSQSGVDTIVSPLTDLYIQLLPPTLAESQNE